MKGVVEKFDTMTGVGTVLAENGKRYSFAKSVIHDVDEIQAGMPLLIMFDGEQVTEAVPRPSITTELVGKVEFQQVNEKSGPGVLGYLVRAFARTFNYGGRAQRIEYWSVWGVFYSVVLVLAILIGVTMQNPVLFAQIYLLMFALMIPTGLSLTWRRLHDAGFGGPGVLLLGAPFVGWAILFIITLIPSQRHTNRYGPHPKAAKFAGAKDGMLAEVFD